MAKKVSTSKQAAVEQDPRQAAYPSPNVMFSDARSKFLSQIDFYELNEIMQFVPKVKNGTPLSREEVTEATMRYVDDREYLKNDLFARRCLQPVMVNLGALRPGEKVIEIPGVMFCLSDEKTGERSRHSFRSVRAIEEEVGSGNSKTTRVSLRSIECAKYRDILTFAAVGASIYGDRLTNDEIRELWNSGTTVHTMQRGSMKGKEFLCTIHSVTQTLEGVELAKVRERLQKVLSTNQFHGLRPTSEQEEALVRGKAVAFDLGDGQGFTVQYHPEHYSFMRDRLVEAMPQRIEREDREKEERLARYQSRGYGRNNAYGEDQGRSAVRSHEPAEIVQGM